MSDPFRPNDNRQLLREAQMGFVVIGLLLCVLVYVLFYRLTGRGQRYQEMARNIPVAQSVGADPYLAHRVANLNALNTYQDDSSIPGLQPFSAGSSSDKPLRHNLTARTQPIAQPVAQPVALPPTAQMPSDEPQPSFMPLKKKPPVATPLNRFEGLKHIGQHGTVDSARNSKDNGLALPTTNDTFDAVTVDTKVDALEKNEQDFVADPPVLKSEFGKNVKRTAAASDVFNMDKNKAAAPKTSSIQTAKRVETIDGILARNHIDGLESSFVARASGFSALSPQPQVEKPAQDSATLKPDSSLSDTYVTVAGDSLWTIAQSAYGDGRYFRALYELNRLKLKQSEALPTGTVINLLTPSELRKKFPTMCPQDQGVLPVPRDVKPTASGDGISSQALNKNLIGDLGDRYYRTKDGDTLFGIARQRLGQASRYLEIYDLNQFRIPENANHLTPLGEGIELLLPE